MDVDVCCFQPDGTFLVKETFIAKPRKHRGAEIETTKRKNLMKPLTRKEFLSLALIAIIAPVLALGLLFAIRTVAAGNEFLLVTLTLCGAVVSGINGFGRRTVTAESQTRGSRRGPQSSVALTS
jgi:hypothetical protein